MKRCPQCEFIYEDDQSLCDMDGVLLVLDSRSLPNLHALATVSAPLPGKTQRRNRMVPAFATLIMMLAAGSVYYVSTLRNAPQPEFSPASVTSTSSTTAAEAPVVIPAEPTPDPNQAARPAANELTNEPTPQPNERRETQPVHAAPKAQPPAAPPARKATTTTPAITTTKPEPKKNDSKVESIIKKTGRILKKPFKF